MRHKIQSGWSESSRECAYHYFFADWRQYRYKMILALFSRHLDHGIHMGAIGPGSFAVSCPYLRICMSAAFRILFYGRRAFRSPNLLKSPYSSINFPIGEQFRTVQLYVYLNYFQNESFGQLISIRCI